jgi:hypothetical protein
MKSGLKIVAINALVLFVILNAIIWTLCIGNTAQKTLKDNGLIGLSRASRESKLPNYADTKWAKKHFEEYREQKNKYKSFVGWQRKPYSGTTVNVSGPYMQRQTVGRSDPEKPTVYFFGGSTMWGVGSDDASTIPSQFSRLSGSAAENFGDIAFTAHQSLVLLIQLLQDGRRPDIVVFYDGVNEVAHKCRVELTPSSHLGEPKLTAALELRKAGKGGMSLSYLLSPLWQTAQSVVRQIPALGGYKLNYDCHTDPRKAQKVADNLIQDWAIARQLVESYGGKFTGVLQPVAFFSDTKLDHIGVKKGKGILYKQFQVVYPLIKKEIEKQSDFYDFIDALDHPEYMYIDFCHLSPNGNRYIAEGLVQILRNEQPQALLGSGKN